MKMEVDEDHDIMNSLQCVKCQDLIEDPNEDTAVFCMGDCQKVAHVRCLNGNNLLGDVFYDYHCSQCSETNKETIVRSNLPWLTVVIIALHNLRIKSRGLSMNKFFHWKHDIVKYVRENWEIFFPITKKPSKTWMSTVSSNLSKNAGILFQSGTENFNVKGMWKLIGNDPPKVLLDNLKKTNEQENQQKACKIQSKVEVPDSKFTKPNTNDSADIPYLNLIENPDDFTIQNNMSLPDVFMTESCTTSDSSIDDYIDMEDFDFEDNESTDNFQSKKETSQFSVQKIEEELKQSEESNQSEEFHYPPAEPSLFTQSSLKSKAWDESPETITDDVKPLMSIQEEEYYLDKMEKYKNLLNEAPLEVQQLYRRLVVRKQRRELGLPILNIDLLIKNKTTTDQTKSKKFYCSQNSNIRLAGCCLVTDAVYSSHTRRLLPHYIKRHEFEYTESPLWFKVMTDLLSKVNRNNSELKPVPDHAVIDYCYIKPQHLPAVNRLCSEFFWPVDVSDCLKYPDFTVVALYKKLVIGCGIMVPDAACNEAYIQFLIVRPEWRRAGIATSMLYHLYQTCMSNDITLHVSVSNPAAILYEKFGFKKEEFVLNFYDKYLPSSSKDSRDAFFYRLAR